MNEKTSLYLHSLEVNNYRQYYNKSKIEFSLDPQKNFTIIQGSMGSGKTSLFNAISWCLYGVEKEAKRLEGLPIVNTHALLDTEIGKFLEMEVTLVIGTPEKPLYQISRLMRSHKNNEDLGLEVKEGVLLPKCLEPRIITRFMEWTESQGWQENEYFQTAVNQIMPKQLIDFFLFDGEELVRFFDEGLRKVKDGIEVISQISLTQRAIKHLVAVESKYRAKTKGYDSSADVILKEIENTTAFRDTQDAHYRDLEKQAKPLEGRIGDIENELRESHRDVITQKQAVRDELAKQKIFLYRDNDSIKERRISLMISWGPQVYLTSALKRAKELIYKAIEDRILPPPIELSYCKSLLDSGKCICGGDISHGSSRDKVKALLEQVNLSGIYPLAGTGSMLIPNFLRSFKQNLEALNKSYEESSSNDEEINVIENRIKEVSTELQNFDDTVIAKLEQERVAKVKWFRELTDRMAIFSSDVTRANNEIQRLIDQHKLRIEQNERFKKVSKRMDFCNDASKILSEIQADLITKVREIVEVKTQKYFLDLIWKKETFTSVGINVKYEISVFHVDGFNATGSLSAGETLYLALSFIAALREVTGFRFPIIIDTPLGRVSGKPRILAAENLPKYIPGTQITMLVTDTEYASPVIDEDTKQDLGSFRDRISKYVGREYKLSYQEKDRDTDVVSYV